MATINGLQLITVPKQMKEDILPTPAPAVQSGEEINGFRLLSIPKASPPMAKKFIVIPNQKDQLPSMPLLKLPTAKDSQTRIKNGGLHIGTNGSPKNYNFPLLKKPILTEQPRLIKIPILKDDPRKTPVLIKIPIKEHQSAPPAMHELQHQNFAPKIPMLQHHHMQQDAIVIQPRNLKEKETVTEEMIPQSDEKSNGVNRSSLERKRKRNRKRADAKQVMEKLKENDSLVVNNQAITREVHQKATKGTQTVEDPKKKVQERKKKLNLFNLLEKAALSGDFSSDEESFLKVMKEGSHLVQEEPYSTIEAKDRNEVGIKRPTLEELLLQNFDEAVSSNSRSFIVSDGQQKKAESDASLFDRRNEKTNVVYRTESSSQTSADLQFPKFDMDKKPKSAAGPSWNEVISIFRKANAEDIEKSTITAKEIGIQVAELDPKIDKIEQMSQTDFTQDDEVARLLLQNLQTGQNDENKSDKIRKFDPESQKNESKYPWQYIADSDFSDVLASRKDDRTPGLHVSNRRQEESATNDKQYKSVMKNHELNTVDMQKEASIQSHHAHLPPEFLLGMKIQDGHITVSDIGSNETRQLLNVADLSMPQSEVSQMEDECEVVVIKDVPVKAVNEIISNQKMERELELLNDSMQTDVIESKAFKTEEDEVQPNRNILQENNSLSSHSLPAIQSEAKDRKSQIAAHSERFKKVLEADPKNKLHSNLRNMSVQLDALDELYDHLEKEMKNSSMLMKTVDTLYGGFFEEPKAFKRILTRNAGNLRQSRDGLQKHSTPPVIHEETSSNEVNKSQTGDVQFDEKVVSLEEEDAVMSERDVDILDKNPSNFSHENKVNEILDEENEVEFSLQSEELSDRADLDEAVLNDRNRLISFGSDDVHGTSEEIPDSEHVVDERDRVRKNTEEKFPTMSLKRIEEDNAIKELALKKKLESKRKALQAWMRKKRSEQNQKYLKEVEEKRQKESRPFVGSKKIPAAMENLKSNDGASNKTKKKFVTEENYQERMDDAQQLLDDIIAVRSDAVNIERSTQPVHAKIERKKPKRANLRLKSLSNIKYKTADVYAKDSVKNKGKVVRGGFNTKSTGGSAVGKLILDEMSPSWKNSDVDEYLKDLTNIASVAGDESVEIDFDDRPDDRFDEPYTSTARSGSFRYRLDLGQLSDRQTPDLISSRTKSRRSIEGKDFVTRKSMDNYKRKTARLVRDSMQEYGNDDLYRLRDDYNEYDSREIKDLDDFLTGNEKYLLDRITDEHHSADESISIESKRQRTKSPGRSDSKDVNKILLEYGLLDDDIKHFGSQETSKLLAEADALLDDENEDERPSAEESIDWNEIDNILQHT